MLKHFLKITLRSFLKKPLLSLLNVAGLSIGLSAFLVISLYLFQENSYEKGFTDYDKIYRVEEHFLSMGRLAWSNSNLPHVIGEIPEIESYTRFQQFSNGEFFIDETAFKAKRTLIADTNFFNVFDYEFLYGNAETALSKAGDIVISENAAVRFFNRTDVLGEKIHFENNGDFFISGVVKHSVIKSHLDFDLARFKGEPDAYDAGKWFSIGGFTYVKTTHQVEESVLNKKLDALSEKYAYPTVHANGALSVEEWLNSENTVRFYAKPIRNIYLKSNLQFEIGSNGDRQTRVTLSLVSIFILVIAAINFMNLTTARSSLRTKEIGVRKVLGSERSSLIRQFLFESFLITFLSALIAGGLSELFIKLINQSIGEVISVSLLNHPILLIYFVLGTLALGIIAGVYPAFYLSSVKMLPLLKGMKLGSILNLGTARLFRNGLVVLQFTISSTLIIGALFIYGQLKFLKNLNLGFEKDQVIVLPNAGVLGENKYALRTELLRLSGVESGSFTFRLPADGSSNITSTMLDEETSMSFEGFQTDPYLQEVLDFKLIAGEWFDTKKEEADSLIVINQAALEQLGFEEPIGQVLGDYWRITGVVEDFYYNDFRSEIGPVMFMSSPEHHNRLTLRVNSDIAPLSEIERVWSKFTNEPFDYYYLNQNFEGQLAKEKQDADAVLLFTVLAIFISCLGLFGLASFIADQRVHEFGVRKVLGASIGHLVRLFSMHFVKLILIAFLISVPLAIYGVDLWLQGFVQRVPITAGGFIIAAIFSISIAIGTVLFQSVKTGRLNPIDTLRNE